MPTTTPRSVTRARGRARSLCVVPAALALVLAACGGAELEPVESSAGPAATQEQASEAPAEVASVVREVVVADRRYEVEVGPVVLDGDRAFVRVMPTVVDGPSMHFSDLFSFMGLRGGAGIALGGSVRVVDVGRGVVHEAVNFSSMSAFEAGSAADAYFTEIQAGDLRAGDEVAVMANALGVFEGVEVVEAGGEGAFELTDQATMADGGAGAHEGQVVVPILEARMAWDESSEQTTTAEGEELTLSSDVLFAVDSADLGEDARPVLESAVAQLDGYSGGQVRIVGHTDDVLDQEYNQALSERRAASVESALAGLTDLSRFEVSVEGKGKLEPRVEGTSQEARRANRRVEIEILASAEQRIERAPQASSEALPEPVGLVATGAEGVEVTSSSRPSMRLQLPHVRRVGNYLVGEMVATQLGEGTSAPLLMMSNGPAYPEGGGWPGALADGAMLLDGQEMVRPAWYLVPGVNSTFTLMDKQIPDSPEAPGESVVVTFVWPDTGQETVTFSYEKQFGDVYQEFRLTDIPVVEEAS